MTFIENGLTYTVENGFLIVEKDGALVFSTIDFCEEGEEPSKEDILQFTDFMMRGIIKNNPGLQS